MSLNIKYSTGKGKLVKNQSASVSNFCIVSTAYSLLFQSRLITKTANIRKKKRYTRHKESKQFYEFLNHKDLEKIFFMTEGLFNAH